MTESERHGVSLDLALVNDGFNHLCIHERTGVVEKTGVGQNLYGFLADLARRE